MNDKFAELTLILLVSLGLLLARGIFSYYKRGYVEKHDVEMQILFAFSIIALVILPVTDLFSTWLDFADLPFSQMLAWVGLTFGVAAVAFFCCVLRDFIRYRSNNKLDGGVFCFIRHPLYTALLLWAIAHSLLLQNWLADVAALLAFAGMYTLRVPRDEQYLLERFGERYLDYMENTGALWPRLNLVRDR